uniref:Putative ovule protein n=1 Tax=Solanum chacoense TaxID=4108 RepID=A0A0V0GV03_SOLCH
MYKLYMNPNSCYKHKAVQNGYPITYAYDYVRSLFSSSICMEYILIQFQMVNLASGTNFYAILYILWRCSYHYLEWYCDCFCWIRVF